MPLAVEEAHDRRGQPDEADEGEHHLGEEDGQALFLDGEAVGEEGDIVRHEPDPEPNEEWKEKDQIGE